MGRRSCWPSLVFGCLFCSVYGIVPEPRNVRLHSVLFNSVLTWEPPNFDKENVTYTVQYKRNLNEATDLCTSIALTECNISHLPVFGTHVIRVRTEFEEEQSNWVDVPFEPMYDTRIGPPQVQLTSTSGVLYVEITDPFVTRDGGNWSIKQFYHSLVYRIQIWKKVSPKQVNYVNVTQNPKVLSDLDPWTTYCLQVQAFVPEINKSGEWSTVFCETTTGNGMTPTWWIILSMVILALFFGFVICVYRQVKNVFFPSYSLPQHFKEFLSMPYYSSQSFTSPSQDHHSYDKITVISEDS